MFSIKPSPVFWPQWTRRLWPLIIPGHLLPTTHQVLCLSVARGGKEEEAEGLRCEQSEWHGQGEAVRRKGGREEAGGADPTVWVRVPTLKVI